MGDRRLIILGCPSGGTDGRLGQLGKATGYSFQFAFCSGSGRSFDHCPVLCYSVSRIDKLSLGSFNL